MTEPFEVVGEGVFRDRRPQPEPKPRKKPFRHTHIFQPVGMDAWDPKVHPGSQAIAPGTPVKRVSQVGSGRLAFHWIEDRDGNRMSVWKSSLQPRNPPKIPKEAQDRIARQRANFKLESVKTPPKER
jgi:hypothetical protein